MFSECLNISSFKVRKICNSKCFTKERVNGRVIWEKLLLFFKVCVWEGLLSNQSLSPFPYEPPCPNSHISSPSPSSSTWHTLLSSPISSPTHPPVVSLGSFMWFILSFPVVKLLRGSKLGEIDQLEQGLICVLQRWHSNCHHTLLFLFVF